MNTTQHEDASHAQPSATVEHIDTAIADARKRWQTLTTEYQAELAREPVEGENQLERLQKKRDAMNAVKEELSLLEQKRAALVEVKRDIDRATLARSTKDANRETYLALEACLASRAASLRSCLNMLVEAVKCHYEMRRAMDAARQLFPGMPNSRALLEQFDLAASTHYAIENLVRLLYQNPGGVPADHLHATINAWYPGANAICNRLMEEMEGNNQTALGQVRPHLWSEASTSTEVA